VLADNPGAFHVPELRASGTDAPLTLSGCAPSCRRLHICGGIIPYDECCVTAW
jgi:hypothetical protein